ncbi:MAG TPA: HAD family hydrolase [Kiloniellaceae bacterium]|nr:HAD family hydrolase [Kiloniellaceae bacterium]
MTPDLIIFDCDGVLIDSELIACGADAEELTRIGYPISAEEVVRRFSGVPSGEMYAQIEQELGRSLPADLDERIEQRVFRRYRKDLEPIARARETIAALAWPFCVASSSRPQKLSLGLIETGLFDLCYPNIFSSALVTRGKPAPDLFLLAAERMGVQTDRCIVIEDSVAGVTAGKDAGMRVLGFVGGSHCSAEHGHALRRAGAELVFDSFHLVPAIVRDLSEQEVSQTRTAVP